MTAMAHARTVVQARESRLPSTRDLLAMEAFKLRKRKMTRVVFALGSFGIAAFVAIAYLATRGSSFESAAEKQRQLDDFMLPQAIPGWFEGIGGIAMLLAVVLSAGLIGSEYGWNTLRVLLGSGTSRARLLLAKLGLLAASVVGLVLAGFGSALIATLAIGLADGHTVTFDWLDGRHAVAIGLMLLRTMFVVFVLAALAFAITSLSRSLAAGIGGGIGLLIFEPLVGVLASPLGSFGEFLNQVLITTNISSINQLNTFDRPDRYHTVEIVPDPWQAAAVLSLYTLILLGAALIVFRRRDITSG
jgi:ABC-type transport system involved in multi-copper enzyme maturation permease subunit